MLDSETQQKKATAFELERALEDGSRVHSLKQEIQQLQQKESALLQSLRFADHRIRV